MVFSPDGAILVGLIGPFLLPDCVTGFRSGVQSKQAVAEMTGYEWQTWLVRAFG